MKLKATLTAATALGLIMTTAAFADSNKVYIEQTGNTQNATITQTGGTGDAVGTSGNYFLQENGAGSGGNVLVVNQNSGTASNSELPNFASLVAAGSGNKLTGFQSGTTNSAEIDQMGNNSTVKLQQSGWYNGPSGPNWFNSTPGNLILQDSTASGSTVNLTQTNNNNPTKGNVFSIGQGGTNNKITATQTDHNDVWIRQGTKAPDLWSWTYGDPFDPSSAIGDSRSLGALSDSTITVNQTVGASSGVNYAALGQGYGSGDKITVTQTGASNAADVNQIGTDNKFNSTQVSAAGNTGWNFVGGEAGWPGTWTNPVSHQQGDVRPIAQTGTGNEYTILQSGSNEWAFGSQVGNYNFLSGSQSGDQNVLYTAQNGDSNEIYAVQDGSLNNATVNQTGNTNTASFSQTGTGNTATITQ